MNVQAPVPYFLCHFSSFVCGQFSALVNHYGVCVCGSPTGALLFHVTNQKRKLLMAIEEEWLRMVQTGTTRAIHSGHGIEFGIFGSWYLIDSMWVESANGGGQLRNQTCVT